MGRFWIAAVLGMMATACAEAPDGETGELVGPELEEGWNEIPGGEGTTCARGDEYSFFVRKGDPDKVVVDFQGGGACWNASTCGFADALFYDDMDWMRDLLDADDFDGFYDAENEPDNPIAEWTHIIVPYCTGDIHWGDATVEYGEGEDAFTIEHKGQVNTQDALDWLGEYYEPSEIFVTGCSAGAYGAIGWMPHIAEQYPSAKLTQLGDSGAGVIVEDWFRQSFPVWNAETAMPDWIDALDPAQVDYTSLELPSLYVGIGQYYTDAQLGQFNTLADSTQVFYYEAMGGGADGDWTDLMLGYDAWLQQDLENYASFLAAGTDHCIIPYDRAYTTEAEGVVFSSWVGDLLAHDAADVACEDCR